MFVRLSLLVGFFFFTTFTQGQDGNWVVTFFDDFTGTTLNTTNWSTANNQSQDGGHAIFIADRIAVIDSNLQITTVAETYIHNNVTYNFTSGWIQSQNHFSQRNGRWEARIMLPRANASCAWPAWWLLPQPEFLCWPLGGELDILEWVSEFDHQQGNASLPPAIFSTYHFGYQCYQDSSNNKYSVTYPNITDHTAPVIDYSTDYHIFGIEINDTSMRWYVDNVTTFTLTPIAQSDPSFNWGSSPYPPVSELFGILNVAVANWGCPQPPNMNNWIEPAYMYVDWVKVYQFIPTCNDEKRMNEL